MKKLFVYILFVFSLFELSAQNSNDKEIGQILMDNSYLSADARATSEEEARQEALENLSAQVERYLQSNNPGISVESVSSNFQILASQISSSRYRVLAYVKKSDLNTSSSQISNNTSQSGKNSMEQLMFDKYGDDYVAPQNNNPIPQNDGPKSIGELPAPVRELSQITNGDKVAPRLQQMRNDGMIKGAAAFPIANFSDFYIILINPLNDIETILHFDGKDWKDVINGNTSVNPTNYNNYKAYWFTL